MPFIDVKTNIPVPAESREIIKKQLGDAITALPGKSEAWLMVGIEPEISLYFKGSPAPAAMVDVSIFGGASSAAYTKLTGLISTILTDELSIPANRIYVKYSEMENWGWNGSNF